MTQPPSSEKPWPDLLACSFGFGGKPTKWNLGRTVVLDMPNGTKAIVHEDVLTTASSYFRTCLDGQYREGQTKNVDCTQLGAKTETIRHMLMLMYGSETFPIHPTLNERGYLGYHPDAVAFASQPQDTIMRLTDFYLLADRWVMPKFKNFIVRWIHGLHRPDGTNDVSPASMPHLEYMMLRSPTKSKLHILCRDLLIRAGAITPPCGWTPPLLRRTSSTTNPASAHLCYFLDRATELTIKTMKQDPDIKAWEYRNVKHYCE